MAENEIGVWVRQCLNRRFADIPNLVQESQAWVDHRNGQGISIVWLFSPTEASHLFEVRRIVEEIEQEVLTAHPDYELIQNRKVQVHQVLTTHQNQFKEKREEDKEMIVHPHLARPSPPVTEVKECLVNIDPKNDFPALPQSIRPVGKLREDIRRIRPLLLAFLTSMFPIACSMRSLCEGLDNHRRIIEIHLNRLVKEGLVQRIQLIPTKKDRARVGYLLASPPPFKGPPYQSLC